MTKITVRFRVSKASIKELVNTAVPESFNDMGGYYLVNFECNGPDEVMDLMTRLSQNAIAIQA